jgi:hypothetical protein
MRACSPSPVRQALSRPSGSESVTLGRSSTLLRGRLAGQSCSGHGFCPGGSLLRRELPQIAIAALNPIPTPTTGLPCGVCSDRYCQGSTVNSICFYLGVGGYKQAKCELLLGDMCPQDNKWDCTCSNQPPP